MEKRKISFFVYGISAIVFILLVTAAYKAEKSHEEKLYLVLNSKIKEAAKNCYLKKDCEGDIIIKDLYDKKYLDVLYDPVSKEAVDGNICLKYEQKEVEFCK